MLLLAMLGNTTMFVFYQFISENNLYYIQFARDLHVIAKILPTIGHELKTESKN